MWKYIVKYHVTVPQEFIEHVLSDEGVKFLELFAKEADPWSEVIKKWKNKEGILCFLPDDAGDIELENF
ncbi:MAG: hypothetical protein ACOYJO_03840 [Eubacterium sp.]|jgi:hypothetical protein